MATNLITQQNEESQQEFMIDSPILNTTKNEDLKTNFSTGSVIDDIISRSLESQAVPIMKKPSSRISFRALSHIIMMLNKTFKKASSYENQLLYVQPEDIDCRRYPDAIKYYQRVVGIQAKRIKTLEHDLRNLVNLARETQKMLADIATEKRVTEERGHGEPAI
ncbi:uncharacterized protein LOC108134723 [Drosophila elegans]|uniref:uncharacterized protein LOC108134723 n=1 Tax=Drosophila elegans TaxID=30023 RepID=UPI0007E69310|nr:uncharacterized protein LOC108134723 [Drosophila elegans]